MSFSPWSVCAGRVMLFFFLFLLPVIASAQFEYSTNFTYITSNAIITTNGSITITNYTGQGGAVTIPNTISGYPVTEIGPGAFENSGTLASIVIGTNVTAIDADAFLGCASLSNLTIPPGVVNIGSEAFYECGSLSSVTIPGSVTNLADLAFADCYNLSALYFEGNAPSLGLVVFNLDPLTVYYLATTSGWNEFNNNTYVVIALWLPQIQTGGGFGFQTNQFGFDISWASGQTVVVEACTNIFNPAWLRIQTNVLSTNSVYFRDPQSKNYPRRFYQLVSP